MSVAALDLWKHPYQTGKDELDILTSFASQNMSSFPYKGDRVLSLESLLSAKVQGVSSLSLAAGSLM